MQQKNREQLEQLLSYFDQSLRAYRSYLEGGKIFSGACALRKWNEKALQVLQLAEKEWPENFHPDILSLKEHYTVWMAKWDELAAAQQPGPDDLFVFPNTVTFPRDAAGRLETWYRESAN